MVISVVVPVYRVEAYLNRCVDSILAQTFTDFELILVDDGSPDNCGKICEEYAEKDSRIRVVHRQNGGLSAARNSGIDIARGEWITFIDSDDWIHPDYLRVLYDAVKKYGADVASGSYEAVREGDEVNDGAINPDITEENTEDFWVNNRTNATVAWGKLYRRSFFNELKYPVGRYHEDEYVTYRILFSREKIAVVDAPIYRYFYNESSISRMNYIKRLPDILEAFKQHEEFFKDSPWTNAYRLEVEKYAEAYSNAIWLLKNKKDEAAKRKTAELREELRQYMLTHKDKIPFEKRKDIYIAAYPNQEIFIRGFGFLKQKLLNG